MTTNLYFNWLFGPHMLGLLYLVLGLLQQHYPPKKINNWYGYRTPLSQSSQAAWDEANRYSAGYMVKIGLYVIVFGIITTTLINIIAMPIKIKEGLTLFLFMLSGIAPPLVMIVNTEKHLTKLFGSK